MYFVINRKSKIHAALAAFCAMVAISCASSSTVPSPSPLPSDGQIVQNSSSAQQLYGAHTQSGFRVQYASQESSGNAVSEIDQAGPVAKNGSPSGGTELWLFGIDNPALTTPLGATGIRIVIDLRHLSTKVTSKSFKKFADRGLGLALCFRWRNPKSNKRGKVTAAGNYDIPPTPGEADRAIATLKQLLGSEDAKRIGNRLFVQFYNEVGGGPGTFPPDKADELFAFATRAAAEVRRVNPELRICGAAVTGAEIQADQSINSPKAQVIRKAISWTTKYADVSDLHLHGIDGSWSKTALEKLRSSLDQTARGKTVGIVSFKWSPANYPDRNNDAGLRSAVLGIWKTLSDFHVICAAYSPYWPLRNKASAKMADKFGWVSIIKEDGSRNAPIFETLQEIGGGNGIDEQATKHAGNKRMRKKKRK